MLDEHRFTGAHVSEQNYWAPAEACCNDILAQFFAEALISSGGTGANFQLLVHCCCVSCLENLAGYQRVLRQCAALAVALFDKVFRQLRLICNIKQEQLTESSKLRLY